MASVSRFTFDPKKHEYWLDGQLVPSVTQVLDEAGLTEWDEIPELVLERACFRGTLVHRALHYLDDGELDEATVPGHLIGYIEAYRRFISESGFQVELVEHRLYHPTRHYAGTLDRTGRLNGTRVVLDFKTGMMLPAHAVQLAAYANCLNGPAQYRRIALNLNDDGTYRVHEFPSNTLVRDTTVFFAALTCVQWKREHGV